VFGVNKKAEKHLLLVPIYRKSDKIFAEVENIQKYPISRDDFTLTNAFFRYLGKKVTLAKYECQAKVLSKVVESVENKNIEKYYDFNEERSIGEPELLLSRIFDYFSVQNREFDKLKNLKRKLYILKK